MTCRPLISGESVVVFICGPSQKDIKPHPKFKPEKKWCFGCRKKTTHHWFVFYEEHEYYEPTSYPKCDQCHKDQTLFPGTFYE